MFENSGGKLRVIAKIFFWIGLAAAVVVLISGFFFFEYGGWALSLSAIAVALSAWIGAITMLALADAAEGAIAAEVYAAEILTIVRKKDKDDTRDKKTTSEAANHSVMQSGYIPTWQRIEMEKEAAAKAENK